MNYARLVGSGFFILLTLSLPVAAQQQPQPLPPQTVVEYGQPNELRGVTKVFVDTGTDAEQRNKIVREIHKKLPDLTIAARPEETNVHLRFSFKETNFYGPVYPYPYPLHVALGASGGEEGIGVVLVILSPERVRVLLSAKDVQLSFLEREPSVNFARAFVRAYERANGRTRR